MKRQGTIKIFGKEYPYKFSMRAARLFMRKHGLKTLEQYEKKLDKIRFDKNKEISFDDLDVFADLMIAAIQAANKGKEPDFDADDFLDEIAESPDAIEQLMAAFADSQPLQKSGESLGKSKGAGK